MSSHEIPTHKRQAQETCWHGSHKTDEPHHHDSWGGLVRCLGSERTCAWCGGHPLYQK